MKKQLIFGIDPSSRKLAVVYGVLGQEDKTKFKTKKLPQEKPESCSIAYSWIKGLLESVAEDESADLKEIYVFVELPVLGRGGAGSTIPQAQINGALLGGAFSAGVNVIPVNNVRVKKEVIGKGNANKDGIKEWLSVAWSSMYNQVHADQDLCDASMIYTYGKRVVQLRDKIVQNKTLDGMMVKRKTTTTELE